MDLKRKTSFFESGRSWYLFHTCSTLLTVIALSFYFSSMNNYIKTRVLDPILFNAREMLEQTPPISEKVKILALDDSTFSFLGGPRMSDEDFRKLLANLSRRKPKAILIDGLLSNTPVKGGKFLKDGEETLEHVYSGAYVTNRHIEFRAPLPVEKSEFKLGSYLDPELDPLDLRLKFDKKLDWFVYGHSEYYKDAFKAQGHITYNEDGTISPFYMISPEIVLPHISLYGSDSIVIDENSLLINEQKVPLDGNGRILINHRPQEYLYKNTRSLRHAIQRARNGEEEESINEGDTVLILLSFATGNTDFHEGSPFGSIPGGLIIASMLSDIKLGEWITPLEAAPLTIILFAICGVLIGIHTNVTWFVIALMATPLLTLGLSIYLFAYHSIAIQWFLPTSIFSLNALLYFAHNRLQDEIRLILIERNYFSEKALRLEESHKTARLEGYLQLGKAVQNLLLPKKMADQINNVSYNMIYHPHLKMAGDWFYVWNVSETEKRFFIGDVMGKGPSAAIPVASIISILKECEKKSLTMEETLTTLNSRIVELFDYHITSTAAAATVYKDGSCELFNCGSPGWFVYSKTKTRFILMASNPLGITNELNIEKQKIDLSSDELLFTFTDGYIEGSRGLKRFLQLMDKDRSFIPKIEYIDEKLQEISLAEHNEDDQSLITIHAA